MAKEKRKGTAQRQDLLHAGLKGQVWKCGEEMGALEVERLSCRCPGVGWAGLAVGFIQA